MTATPEASAASPEKAHKPKRERSPTYPSMDLGAALEKAATIRQTEGRGAAPMQVVCAHLGLSPKSSSSLMALATLKQFGLLEKSPGENKLRLTDAAFRYIMDERPDSTEKEAALKSFARAPRMYQMIFAAHRGAFPSDPNLRHYLVIDLHCNEKSVASIIKNLRDTISFARLTQSDMDGVNVATDDESDDDGAAEMTTASAVPIPESKLHGSQSVHVLAAKAPHQSAAIPATSGFKREISSLAEGEASIQWPEPLSTESVSDLEAWLMLVIKKLKRRVAE
ncbi:hypothetical protein IT570_07585 [Candidatus Sumerlaeota bacterium]|nr:hypothetical protein [Candidatus Sumerlaeota bacterium]